MQKSFHRKESLIKKSHLEELYEPIKMQNNLLTKHNMSLIKLFEALSLSYKDKRQQE